MCSSLIKAKSALSFAHFMFNITGHSHSDFRAFEIPNWNDLATTIMVTYQQWLCLFVSIIVLYVGQWATTPLDITKDALFTQRVHPQNG